MDEKKEIKKESIITIEIAGEVYELHLGFKDYLVLEQTLDIGLTALIQLSANKGLKLTQIATILHLGLDGKFTKAEILEMVESEELSMLYVNAKATALMLKILVDQMKSVPAEFKKKRPKMKIPKNK